MSSRIKVISSMATRQLLAELAQMFSDKTFREQLQNSNDPVAIHQLFSNWKAE